MRLVPLLLMLAVATPAAAQTTTDDALRQADLQFQARELQRRSVDLDNQLMSLEARVRTDQALATVRAQSARPYVSQPYVPSTGYAVGATAPLDPSQVVSIPDARLAASNAAVRAVTQPRR
jgi:hypothetical protein